MPRLNKFGGRYVEKIVTKIKVEIKTEEFTQIKIKLLFLSEQKVPC